MEELLFATFDNPKPPFPREASDQELMGVIL